MPQLWIVLHDHKHGTSAYLVACDRQPSEEEVVALLELDYEPEDDGGYLETLDIRGPFPLDEVPIIRK